MAFIDGDEFLFPTAEWEWPTALAEYSGLPISAVAAFNVNFGSNGHILDPDGLVIDNYTRCGGYDCWANHRVKSIIKGRQKASVTNCSNVFNVPLGTFDENLRPIWCQPTVKCDSTTTSAKAGSFTRLLRKIAGMQMQVLTIQENKIGLLAWIPMILRIHSS